MTADEFRSLALSLPEASEGAHMGHADFRVRGKIFATLTPDEDRGMVKLTPEQQGCSFDRSERLSARQRRLGRRAAPTYGLRRPRNRPCGSAGRGLAQHGPEAAGPATRRRIARDEGSVFVPVRV